MGYLLVCAGLALLYALIQYIRSPTHKLAHIPSIGPSGVLTSYLSVPRWFLDCRGVTIEGYERYKNGIFKVATMEKWIVFCCAQRYVEEISKASDDVLNNWLALGQSVGREYGLSSEVYADPYHVGVVRGPLNRNLPFCYSQIQDEVVQAFHDILALDDSNWTAVPAANAMLRIVCRISNRFFVGLPLCRDPDYLDMSMTFTIDLMKTAMAINLTPRFLQPLVGRCVTTLPAYVRRATKHLRPIIEERLRMEAEYGIDCPNKPNDAITWMLEVAQGEQRSLRNIVLRMLMTNFTAMHTSSMAFTHALYYLAAYPKYAASLREEVDTVLSECGWTKAALDRMHKIDSFLRESQRLSPVGTTTMVRIALKDFTFSDGVFIPAGTFICAPLYAKHHDEQKYPNPSDFDPERFIDEEGRLKLQMVTTSADFVSWGLGRHSCPGRWFASTELKTMLAHVVTTYDVMLPNGSERPPDEWFGTSCIPNRFAEVLFRKRRGAARLESLQVVG